MPTTDYCDLCDLPVAQCVHGLPEPKRPESPNDARRRKPLTEGERVCKACGARFRPDSLSFKDTCQVCARPTPTKRRSVIPTAQAGSPGLGKRR